jgi:hypothetical protein
MVAVMPHFPISASRHSFLKTLDTSFEYTPFTKIATPTAALITMQNSNIIYVGDIITLGQVAK